MSIRPHRVPAYRLHRPSSQAVVTWTPGSSRLAGKPREYARVIADWLVARKQPPAVPATPVPLTITEMILAFWKHGEKHYRHADGTPTDELDNFRDASPRPEGGLNRAATAPAAPDTQASQCPLPASAAKDRRPSPAVWPTLCLPLQLKDSLLIGDRKLVLGNCHLGLLG